MTPRVFISYCWTNPTHEDWVMNLAERLVNSGVEVVIDKWELKEGQDKYDFMEKMVKSPDIDKVLIILDKKYSEKANNRAGGVGTETQIISPKIYADVSQEKFIPIVTEVNEEGNAYVPTYLAGRIYIDLSTQEIFEEGYESLLRNLFKRPAYSKPKLGTPPSYLFDETPMNFKTSTILRTFDYQMDKNPDRINSLIREFLDEFYLNLKGFSIAFKSTDFVEIGKLICDNINAYTPLRNDYIGFINKITTIKIEYDIEIIIKFLEKLPLLTRPHDYPRSWSEYEFDNFRFFIHELFLYLITVALKNENYKFIEEFLYSSYFFQDKYDYKKEPSKFGKFYNHINTIKAFYISTYSKELFSPMADLIVNRIPSNLSIDLLVEADLICYYVGVLNEISWFPITYVYKTEGSFPTFDRLISKRHFEKVKVIFNVNTPQELKDRLLKIKETNQFSAGIRYPNTFEYVKPIYSMINVDNIASIR
jgi:hypothetical protein